ncbi:unnamed protein product [Penicillium salamii]|nr:unnamed protein product [Penicillium salamii]CAG8389857.1 unnamed protein product [Penicillium salamii]
MTEPSSAQIKDDIKKAYDDVATTYLDWTQPTHTTRLSYLQTMLESIEPSKSILELGCGAGVPCTQLLAARGYTVTANDISSSQITLARERLPHSVNLIEGDMMELEFGQQFDAVLAMYSIFHLPRDEQSVMLRRIFGWLKPGGRLLANFPEMGFVSASDSSWLGGTEGAMHWSGWGRSETRRLLVEIGFVVDVDEIVVDAEEENGSVKDIAFQWILATKGIWILTRSYLSSRPLQPTPQIFWRDFHSLLEEYKPDTAPIVEDVKAPTLGFNAHDAPTRPDVLNVPQADLIKMKQAHAGFLTALAIPPRPYYRPHTRGIVSTAGGPYLPVLVISLRMLRQTGSKLPMEVFLATEEEYEPYICNQVLPSLNARCLILSQILQSSPTKIEKYQFKPFAMLFSSFEEILFLDADAFPLEKPDLLFNNEPFLSTGLLTWPDFWASSASPLFYLIAGYNAPPMNLRQSTESGVLLLSKKSHLRTLLLCTYYNFHGPTHYYPLLSQGAAGEGDKETFLAAAMATNEPFYQVSESICALGHRTKGGLAGSAMAQFNPMQDYALIKQGLSRVKGDKAHAPDVFFIHANFPKFNPATIFENHEVNPAFTDEGEYTRAWTIPEDVVAGFNRKVDVERVFWYEIMWTACELEPRFESWAKYEGICEGVRKYWQAVFES